MTTKNTRMASLMATMMVSPRPITLAPKAFTKVTMRTELIASDFSSSADGASVTNVAA